MWDEQTKTFSYVMMKWGFLVTVSQADFMPSSSHDQILTIHFKPSNLNFRAATQNNAIQQPGSY